MPEAPLIGAESDIAASPAVESVSTSAPAADAAPAESNSPEPQSTETSQPFPSNANPFDELVKSVSAEPQVKPETEEKSKAPEPETKPVTTKAPEPDAKTDASVKPEPEKPEVEEEKSLEDEVLDEAFSQETIDLDKLDPEKMLSAQRNKAARNWAERRNNLAKPVDAFRNPTVPVTDAIESLSKAIGEDRFTETVFEIANKVAAELPDQMFPRIYAVKMAKLNPSFDYTKDGIPSLDDFLKFQATPPEARTQNGSANGAGITQEQAEDLKAKLGFDYTDTANDQYLSDEMLALVQLIRDTKVAETEKPKSPEESEAEKRLKLLEEKQQALEQQKQADYAAKLEQAQAEVVSGYRADIEKGLLPRIYNKLGLKDADIDDADMKAVKANFRALIEGDEWTRANGYSSPFETFAENISTVKDDLAKVTARIGGHLARVTEARVKGDKAAETAHLEQANEEKIGLQVLMAKAAEEFAARHITPYFTVLTRNARAQAGQLNTSSQRVEVVGSGAASRPPEKKLDPNVNPFDALIQQVAEEKTLRVNG